MRVYKLSIVQAWLLRAIYHHYADCMHTLTYRQLAAKVNRDYRNVYAIGQRLVRKGYLRCVPDTCGTTQLTPLGLSAIGVCPVPVAVWDANAKCFQGED